MTDQERRSEILKAEAAVRLLVEELARVKQTHLDADSVARTLATAKAALEQTTAANQQAVQRGTEEAVRRLAGAQGLLEEVLRANQGAVQAIETCAREARASLKEASDQLEALESRLASGVRELRGTIQHVDELAPLLQKTVEQSLGGVLKEMGSLRDEHATASETSRRKTGSLGRLIIIALVLALISVGSSTACLLLILMRKG
jgi:hypothetical protein